MASKDWVSAEKQDKNSDQIEELIPNLRFNEFHKKWFKYKIKEIGTVKTGKTPSTANKSYFNNGNIIWVTPGDISNKKFVNESSRYLTEEGLKKSIKLPKNAILVTCIGATIGKICMINKKGSCNQQINAIIPNEKYNPHFIYYVIEKNSPKFKLYAGNTATPIINKKFFENLSFYFPSINEQNKIGKFLSVVDKKIELMEKKYHILTNYKKGVMQKLFNENVCSEVKENNNYSTKWNIATLDEISKINTGTKDLKDKIDNGIYPFFVRSAKIESINSYSYDGEAILIPGDGKIGEVYHYINGKFDYHQRVYKISDFDKKIKGKYVYYYLQRNFFNHALKYTAKATVDSLRLPIIKEMIIKFPHIKEQSKIVHFLENIDNKIDFLEQQLEKIKEFKKYLLQQMFV